MLEGGSDGVILVARRDFAGDVPYAKRRPSEKILPPGIFCLIMNRGPENRIAATTCQLRT